jgi:hypothetical protein
MTTSTKRLFKSCYNGVSRPPKEAWKDAYKFGASGDSLAPEQSRRHSIVSISSLESLPSLRDLLAPRTPPEVAEPPPAARQARPEPAEGDAREDRQGGAEGGAAVRRSDRARKPKQRS